MAELRRSARSRGNAAPPHDPAATSIASGRHQERAMTEFEQDQLELPAIRDSYSGTVYRAERSGRLGPRQIRGARFTVRRFGRRGVDPDEVRRFLARVAAEVGDLHVELAAVRDEANRLRFALREWQAGFPYGNERRTDYGRGSRSDNLPKQTRRYDGA
jgi:DivIVA domain-containing protein